MYAHPVVYEARSHGRGLTAEARTAWSRGHTGALIGVAGAVGAFGGFLINMTLRASYQSSGSATAAFVVFAAFYVVAAIITRTVYLRASAGGAPEVESIGEGAVTAR